MARSQSRVRLTRRIVEGAAVEAADYFLWDTDVTGFGLRVHPGGLRGYFLQYRFAGRTRRYQIGEHGSPWTVETARDKARVLLGQVAGGEDPQEAKVGARKDLTVGELCDLYVAEGLATRKESSVTAARADIENHIKPFLGSKRANLVTRQDIDHLLAAVAAGKTGRTARTARKHGLSRVRDETVAIARAACEVVEHCGEGRDQAPRIQPRDIGGGARVELLKGHGHHDHQLVFRAAHRKVRRADLHGRQ